jgi:hypothetical protein
VTLLCPVELVVSVCTLCMVDPEEDGLIQLRMEIPDPPPGCHVIPLSIPEARAVIGLLETGGDLHDEDGPWLSVSAGGGSLMLLEEQWCYTGLADLAALLEAALAALAAHPPRLCAINPCIGQVDGVDSAGAERRLAVLVEAELHDPAAPRVMVDWVGVWWLRTGEVGVLADALESGELSLGETAWLTVTRREGRVCLRLYDDLVAEDGEDGVLWLTARDAAALAGHLRAALDWAAANPPRIFVPPEPGPREVGRVRL